MKQKTHTNKQKQIYAKQWADTDQTNKPAHVSHCKWFDTWNKKTRATANCMTLIHFSSNLHRHCSFLNMHIA